MVAMVASTGGLEPITRVLGRLEPDVRAAVLIALHQEPYRRSMLAKLLGRACRLPVEEAEDGEPLVCGRVLVTPPGSHLLVTTNGQVALIPVGATPPSRPSADLLLATLAVSCGQRALAVVLSGHGHDGQAGVRAIVRCGGTVLVQSELSSVAFGMPGAAIDTMLVKEINIRSPDGIAQAITDHARSSGVAL